jgi:hypothetical protein
MIGHINFVLSIYSIFFFYRRLHSMPMQANEDCNCYSYDARKLDEARMVHKDHVSAV